MNQETQKKRKLSITLTCSRPGVPAAKVVITSSEIEESIAMREFDRLARLVVNLIEDDTERF